MALDTRWKNPQGQTNQQLWQWAQDLIRELRKGDYLDSVASPTNIANSQLADMAQSTFKGRAAGAGTGAPQDLTATQATAILNNFVGDSGSGGTKGLVPAPAAGDAAAAKFLKADGNWTALGSGGITTIASGSLPAAATQDVTNIPATYSYIFAQIVGASSNTATRALRIQVSVNDGSSFDATAGNYPSQTVASLIEPAVVSVTNIFHAGVCLFGYQRGPRMHYTGYDFEDSSGVWNPRNGVYIGSTSAINALRFLWSGSGNFDAGTYAVYGIS